VSASVAVVGRGFGATVHAPGWELAGARVLGVYGRDDWREGVAEADVVSVATPPAAHAEVAEAALRLGKPVLCEKPLASTLADAERMAAAPGATAVNFSYRALPAFRRFRELLATEELEITWTSGGRLAAARGASWKDDPLQAGALSGYGVHALDYARWLLGDAQVASAAISGDEDAFEAVLRHERGGRTTMRVSVAEAVNAHEVRAGELVLRARGSNPVDFELRHADGPVDVEPLPLPNGLDPRVAPFAVHARALLEDRDRPTFTDGLQAQRLLDEVRRSAS
jgi:UDP-N-acetyl-2-amino-2-deoxyglucuronate dehydrogenase